MEVRHFQRRLVYKRRKIIIIIINYRHHDKKKLRLLVLKGLTKLIIYDRKNQNVFGHSIIII